MWGFFNYRDMITRNAIAAHIQPSIEELGFVLWGLRWTKNRSGDCLQVFIDHESGIGVDNCTTVSQQISPLLDVILPAEKEYSLEVSSPGLDRMLFDEEHFRRYIGCICKIRVRSAGARRRNVTGTLKNVDAQGRVIIQQPQQEEVSIFIREIESAHLVHQQVV